MPPPASILCHPPPKKTHPNLGRRQLGAHIPRHDGLGQDEGDRPAQAGDGGKHGVFQRQVRPFQPEQGAKRGQQGKAQAKHEHVDDGEAPQADPQAVRAAFRHAGRSVGVVHALRRTLQKVDDGDAREKEDDGVGGEGERVPKGFKGGV